MESMFTMIVPKNGIGIDSYNRGVDDNENCEYYSMSRNEYEILRRQHVFDILNDHFDLWIDEGESETIEAGQLRDAYSSISLLKGEWLKAIDRAIQLGTCIYLVF